MASSSRKPVLGLGSQVSEGDKDIKGCRLPTNGQVLRSFKYHKEKEKLTKNTAIKKVYEQLETFYQKANVPLNGVLSVQKSITKEFDRNELFRKTAPRFKLQGVFEEKEREEFSHLDKTFPAWVADALKIMTVEEDIEFLKSMQTDRKYTLAGN